MKKLLCILMIIVCMSYSSCGKKYDVDMTCDYFAREFDYSKEEIDNKIDFEQPPKRSEILSAAEAINYAENLLRAESDSVIVKYGLDDTFKIMSVKFDSKKGIWMISYGKYGESPNGSMGFAKGGGRCVAFKANNGKVLAVWSGE